MSKYYEDLLMSCKSMEELERVKQTILSMRKYDEEIQSCKHKVGYFLYDIIGYESYDKYKCLYCGRELESPTIKIIPRDSNRQANYRISNYFLQLFRQMKEKGINEEDIAKELTSFQKFLDEKEISIKSEMSKEEVKEILDKSYKTFKKVNKLKLSIKKIERSIKND